MHVPAINPTSGKLSRGNYETLVHLMEQNHLKSHYEESAENERLEGMPAQKIFSASWRMLWKWQ